MIYLKNFYLPSASEEEGGNVTSHAYPYGIFPFKELRTIDFRPITIFYGSNGSGKSTLLNLIAQKLELPRSAPFNTSTKFNEYVERHCKFLTEIDDEELPIDIPRGSKIIASEDIFDNILSTREENEKIEKRKEQKQKEYYEAKYSPINFKSMDDLERLKKQNAARSHTISRFVKDRVAKNIPQYSNGETALQYFDKTFEQGKLYLLDEPENSLSPLFQIELAKLIFDCARYLDCQFIIASHSPFILSIPEAFIYDLDTIPVQTRKWHELGNMKIYYEFFRQHEEEFNNEFI